MPLNKETNQPSMDIPSDKQAKSHAIRLSEGYKNRNLYRKLIF